MPWGPLGLSFGIHAAVLGLTYRVHGVRTAIPPGLSQPPHLLGVSVIAKQPAPRPQSVHALSASVTDEAIPALSSEPTPRVSVAAAPLATGTQLASQLEQYAYLVRARIGERLEYPISLRRRGIEGDVSLRLVLGEHGEVLECGVSASSGSRDLDHLALEAADLAKPYPSPDPGLVHAGSLVLHLPIEFKLQR